jgi:hypothetical protein
MAKFKLRNTDTSSVAIVQISENSEIKVSGREVYETKNPKEIKIFRDDLTFIELKEKSSNKNKNQNVKTK